ncbi:hypothetical protein AVEN_85949-1 [Araneus ventricosus]|uniref:Uncharacterized protein n=1 Tax=Araneus ventricosus TaxID=182803 RepID=A0A4Y2NSA4_ARAVE|nr:hypothetical protein AVEN_85949-1 [Araneus ventricosus]
MKLAKEDSIAASSLWEVKAVATGHWLHLSDSSTLRLVWYRNLMTVMSTRVPFTPCDRGSKSRRSFPDKPRLLGSVSYLPRLVMLLFKQLGCY